MSCGTRAISTQNSFPDQETFYTDFLCMKPLSQAGLHSTFVDGFLGARLLDSPLPLARLSQKATAPRPSCSQLRSAVQLAYSARGSSAQICSCLRTSRGLVGLGAFLKTLAWQGGCVREALLWARANVAETLLVSAHAKKNDHRCSPRRPSAPVAGCTHNCVVYLAHSC